MKQLLSLDLLVIEDNPGDVLLLQNALETDPISTFKIIAEETLTGGLKRLQQAAFDIVLVDLNLPDSVGLQTFEAIHRAVPELPVVVFSGNDDEQQAVNAVRAGAQDYLVKSLSGFEMAARTIRYAIERQRNQQLISENEKRLKGFLDSAPDAMVIVNPQGKIIFANVQAETLFGYKQEELLEQELNALIPERFRDTHEDHLMGYFEEPRSREMGNGLELYALRRDGSEVPVEITLSHHQLNDEIVVLSAVRDISERKKAQRELHESEFRYRELFDNINSGVAVYEVVDGGKDFIFRDFNRAGERIDNDQRERLIGKSVFEMRPGIAAYGLTEVFREVWQSGQPAHLPASYYEDDHLGGWYENFIYRISPNEIVAVFDNVTERKQAEEKIKNQQLRFNQVAATVPGAITVFHQAPDGQMSVSYASDSFKNIFGLGFAEISNNVEAITQRIPPEDLQRILVYLQEMSAPTVQPIQMEFRYQHPLKESIWLENRAQPLSEADGSTSWYGLTSDITDRKKAEEKLKENDEILRLAYEAANLGVWKNDLATGAIYFDERARIHYGFSLNESTLAEVTKRMHPDDLPRVGKEIAEATAPTGSGNFATEYRVIHPDGTIHWLDVKVRVMFEGQGETRHSVVGYGTSMDITERKQAEEKLRESETRYTTLFQKSGVPVVLMKLPEVIMVDANEAAEKLTGFRHEELIGKTTVELGIINQQQRSDSITQFAEAGIIAENEMRIVTKTGEERIIIVNTHPIEINGQPFAFATMQDITERKQAESALAANQNRFRALIERSSDGIIVLSAKGEITYESPSASRLIGFTPEERQGGSSFEKIHPDDLPLVISKFAQIASQPGRTGQIEYRGLHKDGSIWWADVVATNLLDEPSVAGIVVNFRDITERKQAEAKLRESEEKWRSLFEILPIGISIVSAEQDVVESNPALAKILDYSPEELATGKYRSRRYFRADNTLMPKEEFPSLRVFNERKTVRDVEVGIEKENGARIWTSISAAPFSDRGDTVTVTTDITERKQAEEKLRESEEKYRGLMETLDSAVATIDRDGKFLYMNEIAAQQLDGTPGELIGKTMQDLFPEPAASQQLEGVRWVIQEDKGRISESLSFIHGLPRWFRNSLQPIHDERGQAAYALLHAVDIHELKSTQQELAELNRTLEQRIQQATAEIESLYDNAPAGYHSLDAHGCFVQINQTELNWLGYTREEVLGRPFADFVSSEGLATFKRNFLAFKERGWLRELEMEFLRKDGSTFQALVNATAIKDENGNYVMSRSTVFDISERKQAELTLRKSLEQLDHANRELERASHAKDEFLANMSHELRTPLNGILGISEIMLLGDRGPLNERQRAYVNTIDASGRYLLNLINDILDLSKIEADKLELQREDVSIRDVCQASLAFIKEPAIKQSLTVGFESDESLTTLQADARRLKQILVNLLGNAVKFTPAGGRVTLKVRPNRETGFVEFSVSDTGIGISVEDQQRLFNPFIQADSGLTRNYEGTGLGLVLVKRLTEMHGGHVSLTSELGRGSQFTVSLPWEESVPIPTFPAAHDKASEEHPKQVDQKSKATILLAEDNPTNVMVIADYLDSKGYSVIAANDGFEALEKAALCAPDLILMDIQMPKMDGLEAIRRLRADPQFAATPIIAVTARAMSGDRERCLEAGATDYISKPVVLAKLTELIKKLTE